jgi:hypothetical protein
MVLRKLLGVFLVTLVVGAASFAMAGVPDLQYSTATRAHVGAYSVSLFNLPNAGGSAFTAANRLPADGGGTVDATISLTLLDGLSVAIENFPLEDMTLRCDDGLGQAMIPCVGGVVANANTDAAGYTQWQNPLRAGAWGDANTEILISGAPLTSGTVALKMNSADIDGSGTVNLVDVGLFSGIFYGSYSYGADFNYDGAVSLPDVGRLAAGLGATCD